MTLKQHVVTTHPTMHVSPMSWLPKTLHPCAPAPAPPSLPQNLTVAHRSTGLPDFQGSNVLDDVQGLDRLDSAVTKPNLCHGLICDLLSRGDFSPKGGRGGGSGQP